MICKMLTIYFKYDAFDLSHLFMAVKFYYEELS